MAVTMQHIAKHLGEAMTSHQSEYQTVTLVLSDGRRLHYTGRAQIDAANPPQVTEILFSEGRPLPKGMSFDVISEVVRV